EDGRERVSPDRDRVDLALLEGPRALVFAGRHEDVHPWPVLLIGPAGRDLKAEGARSIPNKRDADRSVGREEIGLIAAGLELAQAVVVGHALLLELAGRVGPSSGQCCRAERTGVG